jgi:hypothetical protein
MTGDLKNCVVGKWGLGGKAGDMLRVADDVFCPRVRIIPADFGVLFSIWPGSGKRYISPHFITLCGKPVEYDNPEDHLFIVTKIRDIALFIVKDEILPELSNTGREFFLQDTLKALAIMNNPALIPKGFFMRSLRVCN